MAFLGGFVATWNVSQTAALPGFGYYSSQTGNAKAETPAVALLFVCKTMEDDGDSFICWVNTLVINNGLTHTYLQCNLYKSVNHHSILYIRWVICVVRIRTEKPQQKIEKSKTTE